MWPFAKFSWSLVYLQFQVDAVDGQYAGLMKPGLVASSVKLPWRTNAAWNRRRQEDEKMLWVVLWNVFLQLAVHQSRRQRIIEQQGKQRNRRWQTSSSHTKPTITTYWSLSLSKTWLASTLYMTLHKTHYVKTCRNPRNRKYITYCNVSRGRQSHGHSQLTHKIRWCG